MSYADEPVKADAHLAVQRGEFSSAPWLPLLLKWSRPIVNLNSGS